jgi:hypothetical protein
MHSPPPPFSPSEPPSPQGLLSRTCPARAPQSRFRGRRTRGVSQDFGPSLSLAEAWQQLLDSYMPFLAEEAMLAASALMLYQPGSGWDASGQRSEQVCAMGLVGGKGGGGRGGGYAAACCPCSLLPLLPAALLLPCCAECRLHNTGTAPVDARLAPGLLPPPRCSCPSNCRRRATGERRAARRQAAAPQPPRTHLRAPRGAWRWSSCCPAWMLS